MKRENQTCTFCGSKGVYAVGLCRNCYMRKRRNGTPEYKDRSVQRPNRWSENTKKILELYKGGMRQVDIVKEVGLTKQWVSFVIKKYVKPTHADRVRAMTDEELAEWLAEVLFHCSNTICDERCPMYQCCCDQPSDNIEDWLKQEASE